MERCVMDGLLKENEKNSWREYEPDSEIPAWEVNRSDASEVNWIIERIESDTSVFVESGDVPGGEIKEAFENAKSILGDESNRKFVALSMIAFGLYSDFDARGVASNVDDMVENYMKIRDEGLVDTRPGSYKPSPKSIASNIGLAVLKTVDKIEKMSRKYSALSKEDGSETPQKILEEVQKSILDVVDENTLTLAVMAIAANALDHESSVQKYTHYVVWKYNSRAGDDDKNESWTSTRMLRLAHIINEEYNMIKGNRNR